jgi:hypothetical protein
VALSGLSRLENRTGAVHANRKIGRKAGAVTIVELLYVSPDKVPLRREGLEAA